MKSIRVTGVLFGLISKSEATGNLPCGNKEIVKSPSKKNNLYTCITNQALNFATGVFVQWGLRVLIN